MKFFIIFLENALFFIFVRYFLVKERKRGQKNKHKITIYTLISEEMMYNKCKLCLK